MSGIAPGYGIGYCHNRAVNFQKEIVRTLDRIGEHAVYFSAQGEFNNEIPTEISGVVNGGSKFLMSAFPQEGWIAV